MADKGNTSNALKYMLIGGVSIAILAGVGVGIFFLVRKPSITKSDAKENDISNSSQNNQIKDGSSQNSEVPSSGNGAVKNNSNDDLMSSLSVGTFPLEVGSKNQKVLLLQKALNTMGAGIKEDGAYGRETQQAICSKVYKYCVAIGLPPIYDRIVVDNTLYNKILDHKQDDSMPLTGIFTGQHTQ